MFATSSEPDAVGNFVRMVVYMSLKDGKTWVRPEVEFFDEVKWPDGVFHQRFIVDSPDGKATESFLIPEGLKEAGEQLVEELKRKLRTGERLVPTNCPSCPSCGYPDVTRGPRKGQHFKGIYTHGKPCPDCGVKHV